MDFVLYGELGILRTMTSFLYNLPESFVWKTKLFEEMEVALSGCIAPPTNTPNKTVSSDATSTGGSEGHPKVKLMNALLRKEFVDEAAAIASKSAYRADPAVAQEQASNRRNKIVKRLKFNKTNMEGVYDFSHSGDAMDPLGPVDPAFQADEEADLLLLAKQIEDQGKKKDQQELLSQDKDVPMVPLAQKKKKQAAKVVAQYACPDCHQEYDGSHHCIANWC